MNTNIRPERSPVIHQLIPMIAFQLVPEVRPKVGVLVEVIRKRVTQKVRHSQRRRFQKTEKVLPTRIAM